MAKRAFPSFVILWNRHNHLYTQVFSLALLELAQKNMAACDENTISETLVLLLNKICFNLSREKEQHVQPPRWEVPIPPVTENELRGGNKSKRPDFTCTCANPRAQSNEEHEIPLHVECKKLGSSSKFNENYVMKGIARFDSNIHQYGKRAPSGIMIGYIICMAQKEIETEVNGFQRRHLPHYPDITFIPGSISLFQAHQHVQRENVEPYPFELIHLWVELTPTKHWELRE